MGKAGARFTALQPEEESAVDTGAVGAAAVAERRMRIQPLLNESARAEVRAALADLAAVAGFRVAVLSVVRDDGRLQVVAVTGSRLSDEMLGTMVIPPEVWDEAHQRSEIHGGWSLLRPAIVDLAPLHGWTPHTRRKSDPASAWSARNTLHYPISNDGGLRAVLSLDSKIGGSVPEGAEWDRLDDLGRFAARAIVAVMERDQEAQRARLAETARAVLRRSTSDLSPAEALSRARQSIEFGLGADVVRYQLFDDWVDAGERTLISLCEDALVNAWQEGTGPILVDTGRPATVLAATPNPSDAADVATMLGRMGLANTLLVPVGAGRECYGGLAVGRSVEGSPWTEIETSAVADIARDLGQSIEAHRAQEREHQLVLDLQRMADYKTRLVSTVSHDLVSPLSAIRLHLDLLEQGADDVDLVSHAVKVMQRATQELLFSVEGLMVLYRAEVARMPHERVDLRSVFRYAVDVHRPQAEQAGLAFLAETGTPEPAVIDGNRSGLTRVLTNVIGNAIKYTPSGSVQLDLTSDHGWAVFTCRDTGLGMSPDDQERVFDEFYRSHDPSVQDLPGTGLGMAIVASIVGAHGGKVSLNSTLGEGTRVELKFPLAS